MKRVILIKGAIETLEYFSLQLAEYFLAAGREVFLWDMLRPSASIDAFEALENPSESVLVTFNFIGLGREGQFARGLSNIWDDNDISKICIMVDSPVYYYRQLSSEMKNLKLVCIDRYHQEFVEKMYPEYGKVDFMPLGGNRMLSSIFAEPGILKPGSLFYCGKEQIEKPEEWVKRPIDVLFIGNYVPIESLEPALSGVGKEYRDFLMDIADGLISNPAKPLERTLMERLYREFPDCTNDEYLQACYKMVFIDLYVRSVYRSGIVTGLADRGVKVYCTGKDWDAAACKHPENIISTGESVVSKDCLEALRAAKISINMMPWFKAGAHDRVFSSMLAGCCVVSDSSEYLDEVIRDGSEYVKYELSSPEQSANEAAEKVEKLLAEDGPAHDIARHSLDIAVSDHTWGERAKIIDKILHCS